MPTTPVFVDTNVLLYAASTNPAEVNKRNAARSVLTTGDYEFSVQVAQEFFVNATGKLQPPMSSADAMEFLHGIQLATVVGLDYALFEEAVEIHDRFKISYWDSAIVAAAKRARCDTLYSEDLADGQIYDGIRVVNPFRAAAKSK
jgi:predicted nucleic acid-binding protein